MKDFFISYTKADQSWAEWIAWQLENKGYTTVIQAWDFHAGSNFVSEMQKAATGTECTIAVLSPAFLSSQYAETEWTSALASDPTGAGRKLIMVRIKKVDPPGLLKPRVYIDLVGLKEDAASERLLKLVKGERGKPEKPPVFPDSEEEKDTIRPNFPGALPPIWNIPQRRNPNFTGRDTYLTGLADKLKSDHPTALTQAIKGLGGIGKTQIALEYAYRYSTDYEAIWWLRAEDVKTLAADYASFATAANLPEKDAQEEQITIDAVRVWLEQNRKWLFIFDNAQNPQDIDDYLPRGLTGHVLITSRHQAWEKLCSSLSIEIWSREESVAFLIRRTKDKDQVSAEGVAEKLGNLPLALEQAAAFINETGIGFNDYLELYQARRSELWTEENPPLNYPDTVGTTWSLAIEKVKEDAPAGASVLCLCSYLAPDEIPRSIISDASGYMPEELSAHFNDKLGFHKGIKALNNYSLVNAQPDSLSVHRLVQVVVPDRLKPEEQKIWAEVAVKAVRAVFPSKGYQHPKLWPQCSALLSHGRVVIEHAVEHEVALAEAADLLTAIASYMYGRASYKEAETLARQSLDIRVDLFGEDDLNTGNSAAWLGFILQAQGRYSEAEPLYLRALEIRETQLGANHPQVATSLNNLASLLQDQGKYSEAEPLYRQALEIRETQLGPDHPQVAASLNDLAMLFKDLGKYSEAEPLYLRALEIYETQLGADHPQVATSLNNLATLLRVQGKYSEAEPLYRQALEIRETQLGANHPQVATSLNNLASLLRVQGKYSEAEPLYLRAREIRKTQLGPDHPDVATSLNNLASLLQDQGKYSEAEPLYRQALEIYKTQLGADHPHVAASLNDLAMLFKDLGKYSEAEPLYRQALEIYETQLGADHPHVATSLNNLATLFKVQGKNTEAEPLYRQALEIRETQLGANHPQVATSLNNLASLLQDQGKNTEAEPLYRQALEIYETQLGPDHPDVATSLNNLASLLQDQGKNTEAEPLYRKALEIYKTQLGANHPQVATSLNGLAMLFKDLGKYSEAEPLYRQALEIYETQLGRNHPSTNTVRNNLEGLLSDMKSKGG